MSSNWTKLFMMAALALITCTGCGDDENPDPMVPVGEWLYGIKTGKVTYLQTVWNSTGSSTTYNPVLTFDDYGKRIRVELQDDGDEVIYIFDETAQKGYILMVETKTYMEAPYVSAAGIRLRFMYYGDDLNSLWGYYPNYTKKANKTVAGKSCSVYSWSESGETVEWGGWSRITFWLQDYTSTPGTANSARLEATSFTETIPANSFAVPSDYSEATY